jgi:copper chaperone
MTTTARYTVSGMTCGHCVSAVTSELQALDGVHDVEVDLIAGGKSTVTVTSAQPLPEPSAREAVEEAGYELAGSGTS